MDIFLMFIWGLLAFPAAVIAIVLFVSAGLQKEADIKEAEQNGTEPSEKYRIFNLIGFILIIPSILWVFAYIYSLSIR